MIPSRATVGAVCVLVAVGAAAPSLAASGNKFPPSTTTRDCGNGNTVAITGPLELWPPNHKFVNEPVTATDHDSTAMVSLTLMPSATDATGGDGGPQHDPDWQLSDGTTGNSFMSSGTGSTTSALQLRAERSGNGDGRTYTINWSATFDNGTSMCSSSDGTAAHAPFTVTVPHDMGKSSN